MRDITIPISDETIRELKVGVSEADEWAELEEIQK